MKRVCYVCKGTQEFKLIPTMTITLNRNKTLRYCLKCGTVVFAEAVEVVEAEKKEFHRELVGAVA